MNIISDFSDIARRMNRKQETKPEATADESAAAVRTLKMLGYAYDVGCDLWKPKGDIGASSSGAVKVREVKFSPSELNNLARSLMHRKPVCFASKEGDMWRSWSHYQAGMDVHAILYSNGQICDSMNGLRNNQYSINYVESLRFDNEGYVIPTSDGWL